MAKKDFPVMYYQTLTDFLLGWKNVMTNVKKFASFEKKNAKICGIEILKKILFSSNLLSNDKIFKSISEDYPISLFEASKSFTGS